MAVSDWWLLASVCQEAAALNPCLSLIAMLFCLCERETTKSSSFYREDAGVLVPIYAHMHRGRRSLIVQVSSWLLKADERAAALDSDT